MSNAFDPRIIIVGIEIDGDIIFLKDLDIRIAGKMFSSATYNFCNMKISNLTREQRNFIITKATPAIISNNPDKAPVKITVDVGRESYGTFRLFEGNCYTSFITEPPDIGIVLQSLTQISASGAMGFNSQGAMTSLKTVAESVAKQCNLKLEFKVKNPKQIANYSYTGGSINQVAKLGLVGDVDAFVFNDTLVVIDKKTYRNDGSFVLSQDNGMIGIPQATQAGASARMLVSPEIQIGYGLTILSKINPAVDQNKYYVSQLGFNICNRDNPFFYDLTLSNSAVYQGSL